MDILLVEGREILFRVGLALLETSQEKLIRMDMEDMIKVQRARYKGCNRKVQRSYNNGTIASSERKGVGYDEGSKVMIG